MKFRFELVKETSESFIVDAPSLEAAEKYMESCKESFDDWARVWLGSEGIETYLTPVSDDKPAEIRVNEHGEEWYD